MTEPAPDPELPRGVALAWGVAANPQRGPKRELSIERIVEAAVEIADAGGLSAVSMSSVATSLGFTPMSLYRYVSAKDDLVLLMGEQAIGLPSESIREAEGWREGLRRWARGQVERYERHPWLLDIPIRGTPMTPNNMAWLDTGLAVLAETPLDYAEKLSVGLTVLAQTRWEGHIGRGYDEAAQDAGVSPDALDSTIVAVLTSLVTPEGFPDVSAALAAGALGPDDDDAFVFGLERVLDGIERYVEARRSAPREAARRAPEEPPDVMRDRHVRDAEKARREAEKALRDARKREREAIKNARERYLRRDPERDR
jgi:AcrR family transcriptional regulator